MDTREFTVIGFFLFTGLCGLVYVGLHDDRKDYGPSTATSAEFMVDLKESGYCVDGALKHMWPVRKDGTCVEADWK